MRETRYRLMVEGDSILEFFAPADITLNDLGIVIQEIGNLLSKLKTDEYETLSKRDKLSQRIKDWTAKATESKDTAIAALQEGGFLDEAGNLTPQYGGGEVDSNEDKYCDMDNIPGFDFSTKEDFVDFTWMVQYAVNHKDFHNQLKQIMSEDTYHVISQYIPRFDEIGIHAKVTINKCNGTQFGKRLLGIYDWMYGTEDK